ncbi:MAG: FeoA family protein [Bacteroidota bacterium]|nr:FeoA family protein [Bacteroidota bacterium]
MFLDELKMGDWAIIDEIKNSETLMKLIELGCLPGQEICLKLVAPFRDPIAIEVNGHLISLCRADAKNIIVHKA